MKELIQVGRDSFVYVCIYVCMCEAHCSEPEANSWKIKLNSQFAIFLTAQQQFGHHLSSCKGPKTVVVSLPWWGDPFVKQMSDRCSRPGQAMGDILWEIAFWASNCSRMFVRKWQPCFCQFANQRNAPTGDPILFLVSFQKRLLACHARNLFIFNQSIYCHFFQLNT